MAIKVSHLKPNFVDERGGMTLVINQNKFSIQSVLRIEGKAGAIRGNHYSKQGLHYYYVESGLCEYYEKPANKPTAAIETVILKPGDLVVVKPNIINTTKFLEDSVIYHFDTQMRTQKHYERNTVRVKIV